MRGYNEVRVTQPVKIKVLDERCRPEQHGDWCDLKFHDFLSHIKGNTLAWPSGMVEYKTGSIFKISLGVAMQIPDGYHAQVVARSSTRKNYGVMLTNAIGIIDNAYCGDNDIWMAEFYAVEDGEMKVGDRILQFRLVKNGDPIQLEYVDSLKNADRGGFGSTGK